MTTTKFEGTNRWVWISAIVYSLAIVGVGLWITFVTGEWIAIVCASGLVILPIGAIGWRKVR